MLVIHTIELLRPRLYGPRFRDGSVALDVLPDLHALGKLIKEVAKWYYMQDHPARKRLPSRFFEDVVLKLSDIADGSAIPVIQLTTTEDNLLPGLPGRHDELFESSVQCVIRTIASDQVPLDLPKERTVPTHLLDFFNVIGRNLHADEYMELQGGGHHPATARLDQESRITLLQRSQVREVTKEIGLRGRVSEVDRDRMSFELHTMQGKIKGPLANHYQDTILEALRQYQEGTHVQVHGVCKFSWQDRVLDFQSIDEIELLDPLDVPTRLEELQDLSEGWHQGQGQILDPKGLEWLSQQFVRYFPPETPLPYTYPTLEGGVRMEWTEGDLNCILEIDLEDHSGSWLWFDSQSEAGDDGGIDMDKEEDWVWLATGLLSKLTTSS